MIERMEDFPVSHTQARTQAKKPILKGITKPAISRLARKGGVKQISSGVYEEARAALAKFLENTIKDAALYTDHAHRKTITAQDIKMALRRNGTILYGFSDD